MEHWMIVAAVCAGALVLDHCLGEPRRWHPLVGFGRLADAVERRCNHPANPSVLIGLVSALGLVLAPTLLGWILVAEAPAAVVVVIEVVGLWLALSLRGLREHGMAVAEPLRRGELVAARHAVAAIVSRDATALDEAGVATAATESVLENGADAVFASLFWFLVAGLPGVVLHRLVNTLDAMWGYRNERFLKFGRAAARMDDIMNWIPARLTALTYAVLGNTRCALGCWRRQGPGWDSPNAGPVMAAGAGALAIRLGGPAPYREGLRQRPRLGMGVAPSAGSVVSALTLVSRGAWLWVALVGLGALMINGGNG